MAHPAVRGTRMRSKARQLFPAILCALIVLSITTSTPIANAAPPWARASEATIHPGVQTFTGELQCTANFVFYDSNSIYLGQSAHCSTRFTPGTSTGPCAVDVLPLGTPVEIQGASQHGTVVYNSYVTMQHVKEQRDEVCAENDFALVRLHPADERKVNPSLPFWGGPTASGGHSSTGDTVYSYQNSGLRGGISALSPKYGINTGPVHRGLGDATGWGSGSEKWTYYVHTATPGIFGDSGSPVLDARGRALGIMNSVSLDGSNGITNLSRAIRYMKTKTNLDAIKLAEGTEDFSPVPPDSRQ